MSQDNCCSLKLLIKQWKKCNTSGVQLPSYTTNENIENFSVRFTSGSNCSVRRAVYRCLHPLQWTRSCDHYFQLNGNDRLAKCLAWSDCVFHAEYTLNTLYEHHLRDSILGRYAYAWYIPVQLSHYLLRALFCQAGSGCGFCHI